MQLGKASQGPCHLDWWELSQHHGYDWGKNPHYKSLKKLTYYYHWKILYINEATKDKGYGIRQKYVISKILWSLPAWKFVDSPRAREGSKKGSYGDCTIKDALSDSLFKSDSIDLTECRCWNLYHIQKKVSEMKLRHRNGPRCQSGTKNWLNSMLLLMILLIWPLSHVWRLMKRNNIRVNDN